MPFNELQEIPDWVKTISTLVIGAGGAKILSVWLENRRLEKKEYRDTLLGRIRELEEKIGKAQQANIDTAVKVALLQDENYELKEKLGLNTRSDDRREKVRRAQDPDAKAGLPPDKP